MTTRKTASVIKNLEVSLVPVQDINPSVYNPRSWTVEQTDKLKESIQHFGLVDPLIVNGAKERKNILIGGHFRLSVATEMGFEEVPVIYLDIPDIEKEKELNLRLNKNTGDWNFELLKKMDTDLLLDVGFGESELSHIWDESFGVEEDKESPEKDSQVKKAPKTKPGDMFELGKHRLICGDSTDSEVLKKLIGKNEIKMCYSDPPYNIDYSYEKGLGSKNKYNCSDKVNDSRSLEEYTLFLEQTLINVLKHTGTDVHIFYYCDQKYIGVLQELYRKLGIKNQRVCLWIKNNQNATPQIAFHKCYEPCVYGTIGKPYLSKKSVNFTEILNSEVETGNRSLDDIQDLIDIWYVKRLSSTDYDHPTQKPQNLHEKPLRRCTKAGDIVVDLFGGSGSTLLACEQLGRRAFLVEKDPGFCDLILERFLSLNPEKNVKKIN